VLTGSSNTSPSEAMLRNISQNMYGATAVRFDCACVTWLYCNLLNPSHRPSSGVSLTKGLGARKDGGGEAAEVEPRTVRGAC
jgi:hypothetical protein